MFTCLSMVVTFSIFCSSANLCIFTINLPSSSPIMTDKTHFHNCKCYFQKRRILCLICKTYIHFPCSGLKAASFITMGCPAYDASPRTLQNDLIPTTDHQTQPLSLLKMKRHWQHTKQAYCPTQHNLIYRPPAIPTVPSDPWKLMNQNLKLD